MANSALGSGWWKTQRGAGPVIATAIHNGHELRADVANAMVLSKEDRLREEDPYTGQAIQGISTHIIGSRSRFELDLNRREEDAVYRTSKQSWGLKVWHDEPGDELIEASQEIHRAFYRMMHDLLTDISQRHSRFVLLDVHSYNHRRDGPDGPPTDPDDAPEIDVGTFSMPREYWSPVLEPVLEAMRSFDFNGRNLDVRENVVFHGGYLTRFVHENFPKTGCAIAIEFKKFYMDEWTGKPNPDDLAAMKGFIECAANAAEQALA